MEERREGVERGKRAILGPPRANDSLSNCDPDGIHRKTSDTHILLGIGPRGGRSEERERKNIFRNYQSKLNPRFRQIATSSFLAQIYLSVGVGCNPS